MTYNQIKNRKRISKKKKNRRPALDSCPQRYGTGVKLIFLTPKKPNSAVRKLIKVWLTNLKTKNIFIPGTGHTLNRFSGVLIRGGRKPDIPGSLYQIVRGKHDAGPVWGRRNGRSKYGMNLPRWLKPPKSVLERLA